MADFGTRKQKIGLKRGISNSSESKTLNNEYKRHRKLRSTIIQLVIQN